jgi:hypothetical protein
MLKEIVCHTINLEVTTLGLIVQQTYRRQREKNKDRLLLAGQSRVCAKLGPRDPCD